MRMDQVLTVVVGGSVVGVIVVGVAVESQSQHSGNRAIRSQANENRHAISLLPRNVYVAMLFKLLGWAGWPAPCALRVSNQSGGSYSTVAMEYAKGKISARGREISWLNHPCYLGYKGEVGYKGVFVYL